MSASSAAIFSPTATQFSPSLATATALLPRLGAGPAVGAGTSDRDVWSTSSVSQDETAVGGGASSGNGTAPPWNHLGGSGVHGSAERLEQQLQNGGRLIAGSARLGGRLSSGSGAFGVDELLSSLPAVSPSNGAPGSAASARSFPRASDSIFDPWGETHSRESPARLLVGQPPLPPQHHALLQPAPTGTPPPHSGSNTSGSVSQDTGAGLSGYSQEHIWSRTQQEQSLALQQRQERQQLQLQLQQREERYRHQEYYERQPSAGGADNLWRRESAPGGHTSPAPFFNTGPTPSVPLSSPATTTSFPRSSLHPPASGGQTQHYYASDEGARYEPASSSNGSFFRARESSASTSGASWNNLAHEESNYLGGPSQYDGVPPRRNMPGQQDQHQYSQQHLGLQPSSSSASNRRVSDDDFYTRHNGFPSVGPSHSSTTTPVPGDSSRGTGYSQSGPYSSMPTSRSHTADRLSPFPTNMDYPHHSSSHQPAPHQYQQQHQNNLHNTNYHGHHQLPQHPSSGHSSQPPPHNSYPARNTASAPPAPPPPVVRRRPQRRGDARESLRSGLPLVPAHSAHALWCGNVPADATHAELWSFFTERSGPPGRGYGGGVIGTGRDEQLQQQGLGEGGLPIGGAGPGAGGGGIFGSGGGDGNRAGVESIHLITRSNCSFINYITEEHLLHAIKVSNGVSLRPHDRRCKPLLCRVRAQEDDAKSGVGAQRGTGMHRYFLAAKEMERVRLLAGGPHASASNPALLMGSGGHGSIISGLGNHGDGYRHGGGGGYGDLDGEEGEGESGSTSSSLLELTFLKRYFILKSHNEEDLKTSVERGTWATQSHNEAILDQAFRTAKEGVYIVFSVNKSGEWYGYARMMGTVPSMHQDSTNGSGVQPDATPASDQQYPSATDAEETEALGTPFALEWIKVQRLPFARTRTILNSFNMNREVKISRDGTEIEPLSGERLLREFWQSDHSSPLLSTFAAARLQQDQQSSFGNFFGNSMGGYNYNNNTNSSYNHIQQQAPYHQHPPSSLYRPYSSTSSSPAPPAPHQNQGYPSQQQHQQLSGWDLGPL